MGGMDMYIELGKDKKEDDILYLLLDDRRDFNIGVSYIEDIDAL